LAASVRGTANAFVMYMIRATLISPFKIVLITLPLEAAAANITKIGIIAKSARGSILFPGMNASRQNNWQTKGILTKIDGLDLTNL